jgi:hypothetical protein
VTAERFAPPSETRIEYVILCDSAQASPDGKLYILGGGWTEIRRPVAPPGTAVTPPPTQFAVTASFLFDWNDANRPIGMRVTIEHQEERPPLFEVRAHLTAGRPPQATPGDPLRALVALPVLINFPEPGSYCVRAQMEGSRSDAVVRFRVVDAVMPIAPSRSQ